MKTVEELIKEQEALHQEIDRIAESHNLITSEIGPIYDGVADIESYLNSSLKIMWVLKEPYDDFDDNENPIGGGWIMYKDGLNDPKAWKQQSYQGMTYVIYGFRHNAYWGQLPAIRENKSMIDELKSVAYINISKMPGQKQTPNQAAESYYQIWKDILYKQIDVYDPDVIIFGGSMQFFRPDLDEKELMPVGEPIGTDKTFCYVYKYKDKWLLSIKHPARFSEVYVDGVIDGLKYVAAHN